MAYINVYFHIALNTGFVFYYTIKWILHTAVFIKSAGSLKTARTFLKLIHRWFFIDNFLRRCLNSFLFPTHALDWWISNPSVKRPRRPAFKVCFFCILYFKCHACHPFKGKQVLQKHDINRCKMISSIFTHCHHYAKKFLIILIKIKRTPIIKIGSPFHLIKSLKALIS